jgi:hypothetical protein
MGTRFNGAVPADESGPRWLEICGFGARGSDGSPIREESGLAAVAYEWDAGTGRYRWTELGPLSRVPGVGLSESALVRLDDAWLISTRCGGARKPAAELGHSRTATVWYRTDDPLAGFGEPRFSNIKGGVPRMAYRFPDGALRIVFPEERWGPVLPGEPEPWIAYDPKRGKYDRDPETFEYTNRVLLVGIEENGIAVRTPSLDHATLTPPVGRKQWLRWVSPWLHWLPHLVLHPLLDRDGG